MIDLSKPIISCVQDKNANVRILSEKIIEILIEQYGYNAIESYLKDLKKATRLYLAPIFDKYSQRNIYVNNDECIPTTNYKRNISKSNLQRSRSRNRKGLGNPKRVRSKSRTHSVGPKDKIAEASDSGSMIRITSQKAARLNRPRRYKHSFEG